MKTIDKTDVWKLIDRLIEERGEDYVYEPPEYFAGLGDCVCVYVSDNEPSCAVGWMVYDMAPVPETITFMRNVDEFEWGDTAFADMRHKFEDYLEAKFTTEAADMLASFQYRQDRRVRYGEIRTEMEAQYGR